MCFFNVSSNRWLTVRWQRDVSQINEIKKCSPVISPKHIVTVTKKPQQIGVDSLSSELLSNFSFHLLFTVCFSSLHKIFLFSHL